MKRCIITSMVTAASMLLLSPAFCQAPAAKPAGDAVQLENVSYFPFPGNRLIQQRRDYKVVFGAPHQYSGEFKAEQSGYSGEWFLSLSFDDASKKPLPDVPEEEICGPDGIIVQCLQRLLKDVPDAKANYLEFELRGSRAVWTGAKAPITAYFKSMTNAEYNRDDEAAQGKLYLLMQKFTATSPDARKLARAYALLLGRDVKRIDFGGGGVEDPMTVSVDDNAKTKLDVVDWPNLGFWHTPTLFIDFKAKLTGKPAGKR